MAWPSCGRFDSLRTAPFTCGPPPCTDLEELMDLGWIQEIDDAERRPESSERRRYYGLTRSGRSALESETKRLADLAPGWRARPRAGRTHDRRPRCAPPLPPVVWLAPAKLRARHGAEMEEAFVDAWLAARAQGRVAVALTWLEAFWDLLRAALFRLRPPAAVLPSAEGARDGWHELRSAFGSFHRQKVGTALRCLDAQPSHRRERRGFTLVIGLFLRPFRFRSPIASVPNERAPRWNLDQTGINYPDFDLWRRRQDIRGHRVYATT